MTLERNENTLLELFWLSLPYIGATATVIFVLLLLVSQKVRRRAVRRLTHPKLSHRVMSYLLIVTGWSCVIHVSGSLPTVANRGVRITNVPPRLLGGEYEWKWTLPGGLREGEEFRVVWRTEGGKDNRVTPRLPRNRSFQMKVPAPDAKSVSFEVLVVGSDDKERLRSDRADVPIYSDALDAVLATGILRVGIHLDNNFETFCYFDGSGYAGLDIELVEDFAAYLREKHAQPRLTVQFELMSWQDLLKEIPNESGARIDFAIASISWDWEREKKLGFVYSDTYAKTQIAAIFRTSLLDEVPVEVDLSRLDQERIAVHAKTTTEKFARHHLADGQFWSATDNPSLFRRLAENRADVVLYDYARALGEVATLRKRHVEDQGMQWVVRRVRPIPVPPEFDAEKQKPPPTGEQEYKIATSRSGVKLRDEINAFFAAAANQHLGGETSGTVQEELMRRLGSRLREIEAALINDPH